MAQKLAKPDLSGNLMESHEFGGFLLSVVFDPVDEDFSVLLHSTLGPKAGVLVGNGASAAQARQNAEELLSNLANIAWEPGEAPETKGETAE